MQTERFNSLRKNALATIFNEKEIVNVWRQIVRSQLRSMDLRDLYDHYDFNYNIEERANAIRNEILAGTYKVSQPLIYRIEKKFGICRHVVVPQPIDALILQVLVEHIADKILEIQPSKNAFYSRDKHTVKQPHETNDYGLSWRVQWKQLQKEIYKFQKEKDLIAVTDLSNYYDSIDMNELRRVFSSYHKIEEVLIDLLFRIIEDISWKPDYLPYSRRGLPTTNIEGIRLLAHSFLFEVDDVLKQRTGDSFTRWMDDIVIGVDTKKEAVSTLSAVSDMLKSRGLALNLSKTAIWNATEGHHHFQIEENRYLDQLPIVNSHDANYDEICKEVHDKFMSHLRDMSAKYWDKVAKRYITAYSRQKSKLLLTELPDIYIELPVLRDSFHLYLLGVSYGEESCSVILKILDKIDTFDDVSLYQICLVITQWEIPYDRTSALFLKDVERYLIDIWSAKKTASDFYCILWFKVKYNHQEDLLKFLEENSAFWEKDSFLRRQVTSVLSRLLVSNSIAAQNFLQNQISSGIANTVTLASQILHFSGIESIDKKLSSYLFPNKKQSPYPLSKFVVLCSVLNSPAIRTQPLVRSRVLESVTDPYYLRWIDSQYNIRE